MSRTIAVNEDMAWCYFCDLILPVQAFRKKHTGVCTACRSTAAYTQVVQRQHNQRWCFICETWEPKAEFWKNGKRGKRRFCSFRGAEKRRKDRLFTMTADGFRKRWYNELKRRAFCTVCGTTEGQMNFVHLRPSEKSFQISGSYGRYSVEEIKEELLKCEIWCKVCMGEYIYTETYRREHVRRNSRTKWTELFDAVDAVVQPLAKPRKGVAQLEIPVFSDL